MRPPRRGRGGDGVQGGWHPPPKGTIMMLKWCVVITGLPPAHDFIVEATGHSRQMNRRHHVVLILSRTGAVQ